MPAMYFRELKNPGVSVPGMMDSFQPFYGRAAVFLNLVGNTEDPVVLRRIEDLEVSAAECEIKPDA